MAQMTLGHHYGPAPKNSEMGITEGGWKPFQIKSDSDSGTDLLTAIARLVGKTVAVVTRTA